MSDTDRFAVFYTMLDGETDAIYNPHLAESNKQKPYGVRGLPCRIRMAKVTRLHFLKCMHAVPVLLLSAPQRDSVLFSQTSVTAWSVWAIERTPADWNRDNSTTKTTINMSTCANTIAPPCVSHNSNLYTFNQLSTSNSMQDSSSSNST